jgi:hypothetical protein
MRHALSILLHGLLGMFALAAVCGVALAPHAGLTLTAWRCAALTGMTLCGLAILAGPWIDLWRDCRAMARQGRAGR